MAVVAANVSPFINLWVTFLIEAGATEEKVEEVVEEKKEEKVDMAGAMNMFGGDDSSSDDDSDSDSDESWLEDTMPSRVSIAWILS